MSIKYNEFGEVISVNGITTGQHLGAPMQDALAEKPEDNEQYGTALNTVTRIETTIDDKQPVGGASNWSELEGKPFITEGIPDTLTWDGNIDGLPTFNEVGVGVYKVSDIVLTEDDVMNGCSATWCYANGENRRIDGNDIKIKSYQGALFPEIFTGAFYTPMLVSGTSEILRNAFDCDVPSGTYFALISNFDPEFDGEHLSSITIPGYTGFKTETLDPNYLPKVSDIPASWIAELKAALSAQ